MLAYILVVKNMNNRLTNISRIVFPNKRITIFVITVLFLGIITGAIFVNIIGLNDKTLVLDKIKLFITNINDSKLDCLLQFKNSFFINLIYIIIIFIFGLSMLGLIFNFILLFVKGFIYGFSIASFILTYSYKGIILSFLYTAFGQLLNIFSIIIITIYSLIFSFELLKLIFKNNPLSIKKKFKNYFLIFIFVIIVSAISSLSEAFILPALIKLLIKLFI